MSLETKLTRLKSTKTKLKNALIEAGAQMEPSEPFYNYADYIPEISGHIETTSTADIMESIDLYEIIVKGQYETYSYDESHQNEVLNMCDLIINGEVV